MNTQELAEELKRRSAQEQPSEETPKAETPTDETPKKEEPVEKKEESKAKVEDKPETTKEEMPSNEKPNSEDNSFEKLTEGKFKKPEEMLSAYKELEDKYNQAQTEYSSFKEKAITPSSDLVRKINDLQAKGLNVDANLINQISTDWSKKDLSNPSDAIDMVRTKMKLDNPDMRDELIDLYIEDKFSYNEDERREQLSEKYDESEIDSIIKKEKSKRDMQLEFEARKAKPELIQYQASLEETPGGSTDDYFKGVDEVISGLNEVKVKLGDEEVTANVEQGVSDRVKSTLTNLVKDPEAFFSEVNGMEGLANIFATHFSLDKLTEEMSMRLSNKAKEETAKELTNQKPYSTDTPDGGIDDEAQEAKKFANQFLQKAAG